MQKISFVSYEIADDSYPIYDYAYNILYPQNIIYPNGLPGKILSIFKEADSVKNISVTSYAFLMRKLLEEVCLDLGAKGDKLDEKLNDLAKNNIIPQRLKDVSHKLRLIGNAATHSGNMELSKKEIPIVNALCRAILEYIYSVPLLVSFAEEKLKKLKKKIS